MKLKLYPYLHSLVIHPLNCRIYLHILLGILLYYQFTLFLKYKKISFLLRYIPLKNFEFQSNYSFYYYYCSCTGYILFFFFFLTYAMVSFSLLQTINGKIFLIYATFGVKQVILTMMYL